MNILDEARDALRPLLRAPCFLRRCPSDDALLVTDYPKQYSNADAEALRARGYAVFPAGALWRIDPPFSFYRALDALSCNLARAVFPTERLRYLCECLCMYGQSADMCSLPVLRATLKALDANQAEALPDALFPRLAQMRRCHIPLPRAAGVLIAHEYGHAAALRG